ncbi:MAG: hypothetical protein ACE5ES_00145 [Candidatus Nanoarchaeia archaeon]
MDKKCDRCNKKLPVDYWFIKKYSWCDHNYYCSIDCLCEDLKYA